MVWTNWLLVIIPSRLVGMPAEWGFVPLIVQGRSRRGRSPGRQGFRGASWARRKAGWRARQVRGHILSFLDQSLGGKPSALHVWACVCTHRGQQEGCLGVDLAAVRSEPGALGSPRQSCGPDSDSVTWQLSVWWSPVHLKSGLSHMLAKWPGEVMSCFWVGKTEWYMCIHCTQHST